LHVPPERRQLRCGNHLGADRGPQDAADELARGLAKETGLVDEHDDPFLRVERLAYLKALRDAIAGLETARVVLAHATQRNAREGRQG